MFQARDIAVPAHWSQVARDVLAQKYFRKAGVPAALKRVPEPGVPEWLQRRVADEAALAALPARQRNTGERSAAQVFDRLAGTWTYWGWKGGYFDSEADAHAFYDEHCYMLAMQMAAPNSPQWFNTGLHWAYGIDGPSQGHFYVDHKTGELTRSLTAYEHPQPHACFIQGVADDLVNEGGIMDLWVREARLFKYGSGTGSNFSKLRGENEPLSGGGKSSGLMSFLKIGDRAAGAIKSGGTTRRAAKMVIVDIDHPDIEKYIDWKVVEEQKVAALVTGSRIMQQKLASVMAACHAAAETEPGAAADARFDPRANKALKRAVLDARRHQIPENYVQRVIQFARQGFTKMDFQAYDTDWDSEAYLTVSGQNSNNSVRLTDAFLQKVERGEDWSLIRRIDGKVAKTVQARDLMDRISHAAWACADPGLQFDTTINEWHTCPASGRINASNPCSEYMFLDDTACNLASMNLYAFRAPAAADAEALTEFDIDAYRHAVRLWTVVLEISVLMAQFPSREIAELSYDYRTLGLGYANLGGLLMASGIPYDSAPGRAASAALTAVMTGVAYATSAEMARELGPFPGFGPNREPMLRVIRNHRRAAYGETRGYDWHLHRPGAADRRRRAVRRPGRSRPPGLGRRPRARRGAWLPQRPGHRDRADRHDRPGDGLRHHRHRARLRPGQVQEAGRRRLFQDRQPAGPRGAAQARLRAAADRGHHPLRRRPGHAARRAACQPRLAARRGLRRCGAREARPGARLRLRHQVRLQPLDLRRRLLPRRAEAAATSTTRSSTCCPRSASPRRRSTPPTSGAAAR